MPDKAVLRRCTREELDLIRSEVLCHSSGGLVGLDVLCAGAPGSGCVEVLVVHPSASAEALGGGRPPFLAGVHAARICGGRVEPLMGLLSALWGSIDRGYLIVDERAEAVFLYGRDVLPRGVIRRSPSPCGTYAVLNRRREPLGWARRRGRVYANLVDAGWYLRSGLRGRGRPLCLITAQDSANTASRARPIHAPT
ncbi:MAG: hypothetical protein RXQ62_03565 [Nitrososphaeria archaeon]